MNNIGKVNKVRFTPETAVIFHEENDPKYMLFKMALKLMKESREAILNLGEFTSVVMDDDGSYEECRDAYHHSRYQDLEYDMFMFIEMMTDLVENRDKDCYIIARTYNDLENEKPVMADSTKRLVNVSQIFIPATTSLSDASLPEIDFSTCHCDDILDISDCCTCHCDKIPF